MTIVVVAAGDAFALAYRSREPRPLRWRGPSTVAVPALTVLGVITLRVFIVTSYTAASSSMSPTLEIGDTFFIDKLGTPEPGDVIVFDSPCEPGRAYVMRLIARSGDTVEVRCGVVFVNGHALDRQLLERPDTCKYRDYDAYEKRWFDRGCSRYRERMGESAYEVFDDPERPALDTNGLGDAHDFPPRGWAGPKCLAGSPMAPDEDTWKVVETKSTGTIGGCDKQLHYVVPQGDAFVLGDSRHNASDSRIWGPLPMSAIKGRAVGIWSSKHGDGLSLSRFGPIR